MPCTPKRHAFRGCWSRRFPKASRISFEEAAFTTLGAVALHGIRTAEVKLGDAVAVIGLGLVGQLTAQLLKTAGCRVLGIDIAQDRSISPPVGPTSPVLGFRIRDLCLAAHRGFGADAVLITAETPSSEPVNQAASLLAIARSSSRSARSGWKSSAGLLRKGAGFPRVAIVRAGPLRLRL